MLNTKRTKLTPKLSMDMVSLPWKLLLKAYSYQFLTQISKKGFWQPRGTPGKETGMRNERWNGLFIGKVHHQLPDRVADIRQP
jgi:hypothetical protein